jgi:hypothetical protein
VVPAPTVAPEAKPGQQDVQGQTVAQEVRELQEYQEILGVRRPQSAHPSCDHLAVRVQLVLQGYLGRWDRQETPGFQEYQEGREEFHCQDHPVGTFDT